MFVVPHAAAQHARALFNRKGDPTRAGRNAGGQSARPSPREDDRVRAVPYDSLVQVRATGSRQQPPLDTASLAATDVRPAPGDPTPTLIFARQHPVATNEAARYR